MSMFRRMLLQRYLASQTQEPEDTRFLTFSSSPSQRLTINVNGSTPCSFEYSYDKRTWTAASKSTSTINFGSDGKLYLRGNNPSGFSTSTSKYVRFTFYSTSYDVECTGNIMHLISYEQDIMTIPCNYAFYNLFYNDTQLTKAPDFPATTLKSYCYYYTFRSCSKLTDAPALPARTLVSNCYYHMFYSCSKLAYVKAMFTTTPSTSYTNNWLYGVASKGTFVKNSAATWTTTGVSAVPSGWTVVKSDS